LPGVDRVRTLAPLVMLVAGTSPFWQAIDYDVKAEFRNTRFRFVGLVPIEPAGRSMVFALAFFHFSSSVSR
jgi:hypothetical protein